jgi:hypothetical protein
MITLKMSIILFMNQSFDSSNGYHLPRISQNDSAYLRTSRGPQELGRSLSQPQSVKPGKQNIARKLVMMEDIRGGEEYENMNEK